MAGLGYQKGYLGGYYGTNAWNAKTLQNWQMAARERNLGRGNNTVDYNIIDQQNEESKLFNLFIQRFKWTNLPCPEYFLEQSILFNGLAVAFVDDYIGKLVLPCTIESRNIYNEPIIVRAIGLDYNRAVYLGDNYENGEGILLYDNPLFFPPFLQLQRAAQILGDLNRTCEVYSWGLKSPMLLYCSDETAKSIKMVADSIYNNEPYKAIVKETDKKDKKLPLVNKDDITQYNSPNTAAELRGIFAHKVAYYNDVMGIYGFSGLGGAAKMAQTTEGEVGAANSIAGANLEIARQLRKRFCKGLKKMFGDNITVECNIKNPDEEANSDKKNNPNYNEGKINPSVDGLTKTDPQSKNAMKV